MGEVMPPSRSLDPEVRTREYREWAHCKLDELLEAAGAQHFLAGNSISEVAAAREHYQACLGFIHHIIGRNVTELVAPTFLAGNASEERGALAACIDSLHAVWPMRSRTIGSFERSTIWPDNIARSLQMLDFGQVAPVFAPAKGKGREKGAMKWAELRFQSLAALWSIYLESTGQAASRSDANRAVGIAFGHTKADGYKTVERWRKRLEAEVSNPRTSGSGIAELPRILSVDIEFGVRIAKEPMSSCDPETRSKSLSHVIFGTGIYGPASLDETGRLFQALDTAAAAKKRAQRNERPPAP